MAPGSASICTCDCFAAPTPGKFFTDFDDLVFTTTSQFADDPIVAGVTPLKKAHLDGLRARINWLRAANGLTSRAFTDRPVTGHYTPAKAAHIAELRASLAEVYTAMGQTPPTYTDPTLGSTSSIKAVHIKELRAAILAVETLEARSAERPAPADLGTC